MTAIFDQGAHPPCPAPFNLADYVLRAGQETPDKIALAVLSLSGAERWSYARLTQAVRGAATGLLAQGATPGDRVLLRLSNTVAFPIAYLAAIAADLIPVPTSALLTTPEVDKIVAEVAPRLMIQADDVAAPSGALATIDADTLLSFADCDPAPFRLGDPNRPAYIVYTSGTSGQPRAVTHAHRAIWARRMMWDGWYGMTAQDRMLHAGAFNWTYTLGTGLLDPWTLGATALIPAPGVRSAQLPLLIKRHDATIVAAAPGVYRQMLHQPIPPLPKLRHGLSAGEKLPDVTRHRWIEATGTALHEAFGMSECSTFVSGAPARPAPAGTLGHPQIGRRVAILDAADQPLPLGEPGTLGISTDDPGLMLGYWNRRDGAPDPVQGEWFRTGDTMAMGTDGALTYLGRADDMMNAGGFRVSPIEVESAFNAHPDIRECAAVEQRVSDETSLIALYYVAGAEIDTAALTAFAADRLARYKAPRIFQRIDALPKGGNGKLNRKMLRDSATFLP